MAHRIDVQADADLDEIWLYIARESSSLYVASRVVDDICDRFYMLARFPYAGRSRHAELGPGTRTFPVGEYIIVYRIVEDEVFILRVVHGKRNLYGFLGS